MIKKIVLGIVAMSALWTSCSNDIDLIDTKKEIPVVYGLLSRQDTAHYIRIERAFADNNISGLELAKNIDSLYYKDIVVTLTNLKDNKTYTLKKVDGNKEGYKRQAGIFVDSPNYLYKIKGKDINLVQNDTYKLVIKRNDGAVITEAQTIILPDMELIESRTLINSLTGGDKKLNVLSKINLFWQSNNVEIAKMYDIKMLIAITEYPKDGSPERKVNLVWNIANNFVPNETEVFPGIGQVTYREKTGNAFYSFLVQNLSTKPTLRKLENVRFRVDSGGKDLFDYIDIESVNLGITGTEVAPTYSNMKGGYGILSSRNHFISRPIQISESSMDSLIIRPATKDLGFFR
jgi:Domain of unknown function (DUF4249)